MRIFFSEDGDPMLLDTRAGLRELQQRVMSLANSLGNCDSFPAKAAGNPEPYSEFLRGLRVDVVDGETQLILAPDRWLELRASPAELKVLCHQLSVDEDGAHNHWYTVPVSLVIEADDSWTE